MIRSLLLLVALSSPVFAARCVDQPVRFYVYPVVTLQDGITTVPAAVQGDGNWYTNGGSLGALIHYCSGTYDATVLLPTKRKMTFIFPAPIPGSFVNSPIPAGSYSVSGFINVRNLLCVGCPNPHNPFTTHVGMQMPSLVGNKRFQVRFMPVVVDAPDLHIDPDAVPEQNNPFNSSPAQVIPQPYNCTSGGTIKPSWVVKGNVPNESATPVLEVGTAHDISVTPSIRAGQYSMPFEIRIEALQCFTY